MGRVLFHRPARALRGHPRLSTRGLGRPRLALRRSRTQDFAAFSAPMTLLMVPAEAGSPIGVAEKKMVTGLVSTAMTVAESPFVLRVGSPTVISASTRAALVPSTVIEEVLVGPRVGLARAEEGPATRHCMTFDAWALMSMLGVKLVTATSAVIIQLLAPGTSWPTPTAPIRLGSWSSENGVQPGAALVGNDSLPEVIVSPVGSGPPDTLGVQSVALCAEFFGCVAGPLVVGGAAVDGLLSWPARMTMRVATSAITPSTTRPATINHGSFELEPRGGGPGG